jgi:hypothetical protein
MNCANCQAELPSGFDYCPRCGTRQAAGDDAGTYPESGVSTGGGAYVRGGVQVQGGTFVGRDQHVEGGYTQINQPGLQGADLARLAELFQGAYRQVQAHAQQDPDTDADLLQGTVKQIEDEAAKGAAADPDKVRKWLHTLGGLAPDVLEVVVNALTNPGAAVASAVKLVAHAFGRKAGNPATS